MVNRGIPNFLIVGAEKAGTTALYSYLTLHPEICMSKVKEPNFFSEDVVPEKHQKHLINPPRQILLNPTGTPYEHFSFVRDLDLYISLFEDCGQAKAVGEASTTYLYSEVAAEKIWKFNPHMKIVAILRNPLERAFSAYRMDVSIGRVIDPFDVAIRKHWRYIERGQYYRQLQRYIRLFPKDQIHIILYEDFVAHVDDVLRNLFQFLDVSTESAIFSMKLWVNNTQKPRKPLLNYLLYQSGIKSLISRYAPGGLKKLGKTLYYRAKDQTTKSSKPPLSKEARILFAQHLLEDVEMLSREFKLDLSSWLDALRAS